jgi:phosphonate transport system ATP-binding protein
VTDGDAATVEVRGLTKVYDNGHAALAGVDLTVQPGEMVALVGSNGAGKSTLMRCLVRLLEPTAGSASIDGAQVTGASKAQLRAIRKDVGFVFQKFHLVPRQSAFRNVTYGAIGRRGTRVVAPWLCPADVRSQAMAALERVGLAELACQRVDTLSGGQQQRVAIARMLLQQPKVILADEPVASLDPVSALGVMELLRDIAVERRLTVIAALHQVDYALAFTQRVVGLRAGRIALDRTTATCDAGDLRAVYGRAS